MDYDANYTYIFDVGCSYLNTMFARVVFMTRKRCIICAAFESQVKVKILLVTQISSKCV